jgi:hypothetical protein
VAAGVVPEPIGQEKAFSVLGVAWTIEPAATFEVREAFE